MGVCSSGHKFNKLAYPSYCTVIPSTQDDRIICLETWHASVRVRPDEDPFLCGMKKSFTAVNQKFIEMVMTQHVPDTLPADFLVRLVGTLVHGKNSQRAREFRKMNLHQTTWSAVGTALFITLKLAYIPHEWTARMQLAWVRTFGDLMREIFRA